MPPLIFYSILTAYRSPCGSGTNHIYQLRGQTARTVVREPALPAYEPRFGAGTYAILIRQPSTAAPCILHDYSHRSRRNRSADEADRSRAVACTSLLHCLPAESAASALTGPSTGGIRCQLPYRKSVCKCGNTGCMREPPLLRLQSCHTDPRCISPRLMADARISVSIGLTHLSESGFAAGS